MKILVGDVSSTLEHPKDNVKAVSLIRNLCKARPEHYRFMPKYKAGLWDGYISLMHSWAAFPTGFLEKVVAALTAEGYTIELSYTNHKIVHESVTADILDGIVLRDYQIEAANIMLERTRGVMKMATNSGKTEVMAAVIKALACHTVVVVHRKELMYQTAERFKDRGIKQIGMIGDGIWDPNVVTVAMVQTLYNKLDTHTFANNGLLIADETHHLSSDSYMNAFNKIPGTYRFGVSGTPLRYDVLSDMKLMSATGDVIYDLSNAYLVEQGFSAKPTVRIKSMYSKESSDWDMVYPDAYNKFIVESEERNKCIADFVKGINGSTLILVNRLDHGKRLHEMIDGSIFVHGSDTTEYRRSVIDDMRSKAGVFIASPIFDEGVDVPGVDMVIIAAGGKSHVKLLQRIGRGMRRKVGSNKLTILDFIDDTNKFLLEHSNERIDTYVNEGFDTELID